MGLTYFKRFQMQAVMGDTLPRLPVVPTCYRIVPWSPDLLDDHAEAKYQSFSGEIDACVFPCLGDHDGCNRLMHEIVSRESFLPGSTWLVRYHSSDGSVEPCGTIQALQTGPDQGSVQNLGIAPRHRGFGLGATLLLLAMRGFLQAGLRRAHLEVTAENLQAVRLYQRFGFRSVRTVYKAVEVAYS